MGAILDLFAGGYQGFLALERALQSRDSRPEEKFAEQERI
jgi:hypothetical protein